VVSTSHLTRLKTQIKDKSMLKKSLKELGYKVLGNSNITEYSGKKHTVEVALSDRVGFQQKNGCFEFIGDMMYFKTPKERFLDSLNQRYAYNKIMDSVKSKGYLSSEKTLADGTIKLSLRKVGV
jgi:hypothetical protein